MAVVYIKLLITLCTQIDFDAKCRYNGILNHRAAIALMWNKATPDFRKTISKTVALGVKSDKTFWMVIVHKPSSGDPHGGN
jgi:hypothetical protein